MAIESSHQGNLLRTAAAAFSALCVIVIGYYAVSLQVNHDGREYAVMAARKAVTGTDTLLKQADTAAEQAREFLTGPCSPDVRRELARLTIQQPNLRIISLISGNQLTCSSFGTFISRTVDLKQFTDHRLSLRSGSVVTPGSPLVILLTSFPEGIVTVSVGASQLIALISPPDSHSVMAIRIGNQRLSSEGNLIPASHLADVHEIHSDLYPFSVEFSYPVAFPFRQVLERGKAPIVLFILFGVLSGILVWRYSFRQPTPYDHLAKAISRNEILPWYQPVIHAQSGEIYGVEVLARWRHPTGVFIPPDVFIPQAEKSGLIIPLTRLLMNRVADELAPVIQRMRPPFHIAFNISAAHIRAGNLTASDFREFQSAFPEGSIQLVAEITEREPFEQSPELTDLLRNLHQQGVQVALDDFGTGYSNLGYLNTLPIDYIKIDRSFVNHLKEGEGSDRLVACVTSMAETLGIGMIAEGVESGYQAEWLVAHHVTFLQGYYFSRPLPASGLIRMVVLQGKHFNL